MQIIIIIQYDRLEQLAAITNLLLLTVKYLRSSIIRVQGNYN